MMMMMMMMMMTHTLCKHFLFVNMFPFHMCVCVYSKRAHWKLTLVLNWALLIK